MPLYAAHIASMLFCPGNDPDIHLKVSEITPIGHNIRDPQPEPALAPLVRLCTALTPLLPVHFRFFLGPLWIETNPSLTHKLFGPRQT